MYGAKSYKATFVALLATIAKVAAQEDDSNAIWHNRYHAVLAMSAYGDYAGLCPQVFTEATMRQNFPDTDLAAWDIVETFGPTPSGAQGFTVQIPEMDKVVLVFRGDYAIENNISQEVASWESLGLGACDNCTVNAQALQAYLEAREATNNWALSRARVEETGLEYSITGHGFGGMLSLIASVDLGWAGVCRWSHNYGTPRTFNQAGVDFYTRLFQGVSGERGVANSDPIPEIIPAGPNYAHTGTTFYYHGFSNVTHMNMVVCRDNPGAAECAPREPLDIVDHYFYFSNVRQCGQGRWRENREANQQFIASQNRTSSTVSPTISTLPTDAATTANATSTLPRPTAISNPANAISEGLLGLRSFLSSFVGSGETRRRK